MNTLPKDPIILLSYVNTQLRDNYNSLEEMCQALDTDQSNIISVLSGIGYRYEPAQNCFRSSTISRVRSRLCLMGSDEAGFASLIYE